MYTYVHCKCIGLSAVAVLVVSLFHTLYMGHAPYVGEASRVQSVPFKTKKAETES